MSERQPTAPAGASPFAVSRRNLLRGLLLGVPAAVALAPGRAWAQALETCTLSLVNTHTAERVRVDFLRGGEWCPEALARLEHVLRDHRSGLAHPMDRGLFQQLHDLAVLADREPHYEIISGYRSPQSNARLHEASSGVAKKSLHMEGRAIDVRLAGLRTDRLRDLALATAKGGVGYYRASDFVHLDTGRVRHWAG